MKTLLIILALVVLVKWPDAFLFPLYVLHGLLQLVSSLFAIAAVLLPVILFLSLF